jgi:hypothetical protein
MHKAAAVKKSGISSLWDGSDPVTARPTVHFLAIAAPDMLVSLRVFLSGYP